MCGHAKGFVSCQNVVNFVPSDSKPLLLASTQGFRIDKLKLEQFPFGDLYLK